MGQHRVLLIMNGPAPECKNTHLHPDPFAAAKKNDRKHPALRVLPFQRDRWTRPSAVSTMTTAPAVKAIRVFPSTRVLFSVNSER